MISACMELATVTGVAEACRILEMPRSTLYRLCNPIVKSPEPERGQPKPPRALDDSEKEAVRAVLNSERFQDQSPREVYATLLDEGVYFCHWRTMYRILDEHNEVQERRNQLRHPTYAKPELLATEPNQLWSWDITKLRGPVKLCYYYLYVMLDVFSRYVVGWMVAERESAALAGELITAACTNQGVAEEQLTIHADRGGPMIAKPVALLMSDLGVAKSHSRPHVPDDNAYSEAHFRTLKYCPTYPERFGSLFDARRWSQQFFTWYNQQHHHTGLSLLTPADVHYGRAEEKLAHRQVVLQQAYQLHPERFVRGEPTPTELPDAVWINQPGTPLSNEIVSIALSESPQSPILPVAGTEDRALLGSNPSADTGKRCNPGQGPVLCPGPTGTPLHCSGKR
jgi:putative transposase